jgi:acetylglutamate kinase
VQVRFVQADAVRKQLNGGHIVLLGNLAYSAAGEVLNCDCYSVATQAAIDLQADKLFCMTTPSLQPFDLPHWLPISDAEQLLQNLLESKDKDAHAPIQQSGTGHISMAVASNASWYHNSLPCLENVRLHARKLSI